MRDHDLAALRQALAADALPPADRRHLEALQRMLHAAPGTALDASGRARVHTLLERHAFRA